MAIYPPWLPPALPVWVSWWQAQQQTQSQTAAAVDPPVSGPAPQNPPVVGAHIPDAVTVTAWTPPPPRSQATVNLNPPISGPVPQNPPIVGARVPDAVAATVWLPPPPRPPAVINLSPPISGPSPQNPPIIGTRTPDALISWQQAQARSDAHNAVAQAQQHTGNLTPPVSGALPVTKLTGVAGFCAIYGATAGGPPVPPAYTGPLDLAPALVGYSLRALSSAWRGQNVTTLRRDGDNHTQAFVALSTTGVFDTASAATFQSGGGSLNCYHALWNDQSGNGNDASPFLTPGHTLGDLEPLYVASDSGIGNRSTLDYFDNTDPSFAANMSLASITPPSGAFTMFAVTKIRWNTPGGTPTLMSMGTSDTNTAVLSNYWSWNVILGLSAGTSGSFHMQFGTPQATYGTGIYDGTYHVFEAVFDPSSPGSSLFLVDGVSQPITSTTGTPSVGNPTTGAMIIGGRIEVTNGANPFVNGYADRYAEFILIPSSISAPTRSTIRQNIGTYYGITVAP